MLVMRIAAAANDAAAFFILLSSWLIWRDVVDTRSTDGCTKAETPETNKKAEAMLNLMVIAMF